MQRYSFRKCSFLSTEYACAQSDIGASCGENATFELLKLELGAGKVYAGCLTELEGKREHLTRIGYYTSVNQKLDANYTVRHRNRQKDQ